MFPNDGGPGLGAKMWVIDKATALAGGALTVTVSQPIHVTRAGEDSYVGVLIPSGNRWGDYSTTVVDPSDDRSFWTLQQFAAPNVGGGDAGSRWGTWWALKGRAAAGAPVVSTLGLIAIACALLLVGMRLIRRRVR